MSKSSKNAGGTIKETILKLLRTKGPLSKADMARTLGLSFPAVTYNVKKLLDDNLIYFAGCGDNVLGRKATLLAFNSQKAYLVGVDLGRNNIRTMSADIAGNILAYQTRPIKSGNVFDQVIENIYDIVKKTNISIEDVIGIGVGIPGIYDSETDTHRLIPFVEGWGDQSLMATLEDEFSTSIFMENSVNLGAIGERWKGAANGFDFIAYLDFGVGFGSALIMNGELVRGKNGAFGEIAYMMLNKDNLPDKFSEEGALEKIIPSERIGRIIASKFSKSTLIDIKQVFEMINEEDMDDSIFNAPTYFAMAIANTISVTNPEILVISGRLGCALYSGYKEYIDHVVNNNVPCSPKIVCTELAERANVIGAIALAMVNSNSNYDNLRQFK